MVKKPDVYLFKEWNCPYCNELYHKVLLPMEDEINLTKIDVEESETELVKKWRNTCKDFWGKGVTPVVKIGNYWIPGWKKGKKEKVVKEMEKRIGEALGKIKGEKVSYERKARIELREKAKVSNTNAECWTDCFTPLPDFKEVDRLGDMIV